MILRKLFQIQFWLGLAQDEEATNLNARWRWTIPDGRSWLSPFAITLWENGEPDTLSKRKSFIASSGFFKDSVENANTGGQLKYTVCQFCK